MLEYNPDVFRRIRETFGLTEDAFKDAWGADLDAKINDGGSSQVR